MSCVAVDVTSISVAQWATYALLAASAASTGVGANRLSRRADASVEWPVVGYLRPVPSGDPSRPRSVVATVARHKLRRECNEGTCVLWLLDASNAVVDSRVVSPADPVELRMSPDRRWVVLDLGGARSWSVLSVPRPLVRQTLWSGPAVLAALCALAALALQLRNGVRAAGLRAFLLRARPCTVDAHGSIQFEDGLFPRVATTRSRVRPGPASVLDSPLPTLVSYRTHGIPEVSAIRPGVRAELLRQLEQGAPRRATAIALSLLALVAPLAMLLG